MCKKKRMMDRDPMERTLAGVVEAIGEDTLLEHIIENMDREERNSFALEIMSNGTRGDLHNDDWVDSIVSNIKDIGRHDKDQADYIQMRLIHKVSGIDYGED